MPMIPMRRYNLGLSVNLNISTNSSLSDDDEIDLPAPEIAKLNQIRECFNTQNRMMRREKLSAALKDNSYIPKVSFFYLKKTKIF